ncbi:uncharacterized protein CLUP02_17328 [Colletotrichum lupini]|uniref:Uncharacterized protein n=1 Tax=Colletotrichum lupini TaxID=145971 RepID=A0A9Q8SF39_9PEZI|nr:uncharacterized protein CLUP02_17328 [Colletotrichum lupini]UQC75820.1 hypothetical protein CLUP02_17328 [Colletotrichum lupini]
MPHTFCCMSTDQAKKQHSSAVSVGTFLECIPVDNPRITVVSNQTLSMTLFRHSKCQPRTGTFFVESGVETDFYKKEPILFLASAMNVTFNVVLSLRSRDSGLTMARPGIRALLERGQPLQARWLAREPPLGYRIRSPSSSQLGLLTFLRSQGAFMIHDAHKRVSTGPDCLYTRV